MAQLPDGRALPGRLLIVEAMDGSGRDAPPEPFDSWRLSQGCPVA